MTTFSIISDYLIQLAGGGLLRLQPFIKLNQHSASFISLNKINHLWIGKQTYVKRKISYTAMRFEGIHLRFCSSNCAEGCSERNCGSSISKGSIAGIAIYTSSVENGILQQGRIIEEININKFTSVSCLEKKF